MNKALVYFYGKTCGPCRVTTKILDDANTAGKLPVPLMKFEASDNPVIANEFGVASVPTLVLAHVADDGVFKGEIKRWQGLPLKIEDVIAAINA